MKTEKEKITVPGGPVDSTIAIPSDLRRRLKTWTAERGVTMASVVREVLEAVLAGKVLLSGAAPRGRT